MTGLSPARDGMKSPPSVNHARVIASSPVKEPDPRPEAPIEGG